MSTEQHSDPSSKWLVFFFVCFGIVMLGIVVFFARDYNSQQSAPAPASGGHGGMILPQDGDYAPHARRLPVV